MESFAGLELVRPLGQGGVASATLARGGGREVVLKRLLAHLVDHPAHQDTLAREARVLGRLPASARTPSLIDAGIWQGQPFLVHSLAPGQDLGRVLEAREGRIARPAALRLISDCAMALAEVHSATDDDGAPLGLVHRDVCPHNLVVDRDGRAVLIDFGIATTRATATLEGPGNRQGAEPSRPQGRPAYQAPEDIRGEGALDGRADQFSLAVMAWELLAASRLWKRSSPAATLHAVVHEPAPPLPGAAAPAVDAVLARGLAKDPAARYASCREFAEALGAAHVQTG
jgi:serine/threonine-protein kinase